MQLQVTNSPFSQEQSDKLNQLLPSFTAEQRIWLSGYLTFPQSAQSGLVTSSTVQEIPVIEQSQQNENQINLRTVTILFGTETGNAQMIAEDLAKKIEALDFQVKSSALDEFKPRDLKKVEDLFIITATHGEGDPPDNALTFHEFLHGRKAPKLEKLRYSVLSLGDQSYEYFCQTGKDFDKRLEELGGERIYSRMDCDVDFDEPAAEWVEGVLGVLQKTQVESNTTQTNPLTEAIAAEETVYSRTSPFNAEVLENINLNGSGSNKETRHLELSLEGSNFEFEPGDCLGIYPKNDPNLVEKIIEELNWDPEESVQINKQGENRSLREALNTNFEISRLTMPLLQKAGEIFNNDSLKKLLKSEKKEEQKEYIHGRDLFDLVKDYPPNNIGPGELVEILRKIPARLYSITSSYKANPDEVHLAIGLVKYPAHRQVQSGVCSGYCAEHVEPGDQLSVYIHQNPNFKFPVDLDTPVIMVGPGAGVAPYRSYLEELEELEESKGKTWLFYGDQHFESDFLYQVDWQRWLRDGVLTRMDVAFSRDTDEKVYVQHRMLEKSKDLYQWIEDGAHIYVCGDEKYMAADVHATLVTIIEREGGLSHEEAELTLSEMRKQKRYQRDVY